MRHSFSSIFPLIAAFLVMTVLTSGIAMAAYLCPEDIQAPVQTMEMDDMPCSEMDMEAPVQCAEYQSGADLALEHLATAPTLAPVVISFVMPASLPIAPNRLVSYLADRELVDGTGPPYLQTLRLRI